MFDFDEFYTRTKGTFQHYSYKDRSVWRNTKFKGDYRSIPSRTALHVRGFVDKEGRRIHYVIGDESQARIPRKTDRKPHHDNIKDCTFHSQPTDYLYSDIPSWEDVYDFLNWSHREHIIIGRKFISSLIKTELTLELVAELWKREEERPYKMSYARKHHPDKAREKYCLYALRGAGLRLPSRLSTCQNEWPEIFGNCGIKVVQISRVSP